MKNILILAKMDLFREQLSNNRLQFLNFLNTKDNIKILNDTKNINLISEITKLKKEGWETEIIIYL